MRTIAFVLLIAVVSLPVFGQVDVEHRRTVAMQTGMAVGGSEEALGGFGYFWFNENNYPWTNTALRIIFAGVYVDSELSYFVAGNTNTAIGVGGGGGLFLDSVTPYVNGERLSHQSFYGDDVGGRIFINQKIPNPTPLPLNVRGSYVISQTFYRDAGDTKNFDLPPDFYTQTIRAELRLGGMEPGLLSRLGAELYLEADANYRSGMNTFGPVGGPALGHQTEYQRVFGSLGAKLPAGQLGVTARICGGYGDHLDELSAWKLGGNLINVEPLSYTLHGYYLHEFFTDRFVMSNLALSVPLTEKHHVRMQFYGDWANARGVPPLAREYHNYFGVGTGFSFRGPWDTDMLLSYGYGVNAIRNGDRGGHEVALGLERQF